MPSWMVALFFGFGVAGWAYVKLTRHNGNPTPWQDFAGAAIAGFIAFFVLFTLMKFVLNF